MSRSNCRGASSNLNKSEDSHRRADDVWSLAPPPAVTAHLLLKRSSLSCRAQPLMSSYCPNRTYIRHSWALEVHIGPQWGRAHIALSDSPSHQMQNRTEKCGAQLPLCAPASSSQQHLFRKSTTYLAKVAVILQEAPGKMLTFTQVRRSGELCNQLLSDTQSDFRSSNFILLFSSWWTNWHHSFVRTENLSRTTSESVYQPTNVLSR